MKKLQFSNYDKNGSFNFKPDIGISFKKNTNDEWETSINVRILNKEESPFPFDLDVVISLITKFNGEIPSKEELINYLKFGSVNILFPYVRSVVTNVSTAAMVVPLILPLVDVKKISENIKIPELEG